MQYYTYITITVLLITIITTCKLILFCNSVVNSVTNDVLNLDLDYDMFLTEGPLNDDGGFAVLFLVFCKDIIFQREQRYDVAPVGRRQFELLSDLEETLINDH